VEDPPWLPNTKDTEAASGIPEVEEVLGDGGPCPEEGVGTGAFRARRLEGSGMDAGEVLLLLVWRKLLNWRHTLPRLRRAEEPLYLLQLLRAKHRMDSK
jgi:hypothetical protein